MELLFFSGYNFYNSTTFGAYSCHIITPSVLINIKIYYLLYLFSFYYNIYFIIVHTKKHPRTEVLRCNILLIFSFPKNYLFEN